VEGLKRLGLEIGIENTWLALVFQYGLLMTIVFVIGLFLLFWEFWRRTREGGALLFLYFLIIISSAMGLAAKTMIFAQFAILLLFLFAKDPDAEPSPLRLQRQA
jgi:O-antigen ligase